jgi:hypothetical protein
MNREKPQTKPKRSTKLDDNKPDDVEAPTPEAEDKSIEEEGDPLGANFA